MVRIAKTVQWPAKDSREGGCSNAAMASHGDEILDLVTLERTLSGIFLSSTIVAQANTKTRCIWGVKRNPATPRP